MIPVVIGLVRFTIDIDPLDRMAKGSTVRQDADWFEARFAGSNLLELFIETEAEGDAVDPALLASVAEIEAKLEAWPEIDTVVTLSDAIAETHRAFAPDLAAEAAIPSDPGIIGEYLFLFDMAGGEGVDALVDADRRVLHLIARVPSNALRGTFELGNRAAHLAEPLLPNGLTLEPSGMTYMFGGFLDDLIAGQNQALAFSLISVAVLMIIGLRSFKVGMWSMIPNALPTAVVLGYLGLVYDQVDSDSLIAVLMAVGIGVDDTIHFLMRYRLESARHDPDVAIARTSASPARRSSSRPSSSRWASCPWRSATTCPSACSASCCRWPWSWPWWGTSSSSPR